MHAPIHIKSDAKKPAYTQEMASLAAARPGHVITFTWPPQIAKQQRPAALSARSFRCAASQDDEAEPAIMGDWRSFRAKLVADGAAASDGDGGWSTRRTQPNLALLRDQDPALAEEDLWAHPTGVPERGGLLVASSSGQEAVLPQDYWQAVCLLVECGPQGSVGFLLNRPTGLTMGRAPLTGPGGRSQLCVAFPQNRVYCGGLNGQQLISPLHGYKGIEGSKEVVPGIYLGGQEAATATVLAGQRPAVGFKFFSGCIAWGPGELEQEVAAGGWHCAACSRSLALKQCLALPVPLWVETLRLMGGRYAEEAAEVYGADDSV